MKQQLDNYRLLGPELRVAALAPGTMNFGVQRNCGPLLTDPENMLNIARLGDNRGPLKE